MQKPGRNGIRMLTVLLLSLLLCGCGREGIPSGLFLGTSNAYSRVLCSRVDGYVPENRQQELQENLYSCMQEDNLLPCLHVQGIPAVKNRIGRYFQPHAVLTAVIAVDRDQTDCRIWDWEDLRTADLPVSIPRQRVRLRTITAAMAYGLDGEDYSISSAVELMSYLEHRGNLLTDGENAPVTLCFDTEAVFKNREGRNLEIIVPKSGTLSYELGVLSNREVTADLSQGLLQEGFRLPDGRCDPSLYPDEDAYEQAKLLQDLVHFSRKTESTTRQVRRNGFHRRYLNSADKKENILMMTLAMVLTLVWTATALYRSTSNAMRKWIWLASSQMILWMFSTAIKYQLVTYNLLTRMLWYSYYLFTMGLPLTLLCMVVQLDRVEEKRRMPPWMIPFLCGYPILVATVFTNDFHMLVFRFDLQGNWNDNYSYGIVYYLIFAFCILSFLLAVGILLVKSRRSPKNAAWFLPAVAAFLLLFYNSGYALGIDLIRDSNLTLFFCLLALVFMESILSAGLIPNNRFYRTLVSSAPLGMQLLDQQGQVTLSATEAVDLTEAERKQILERPGEMIRKSPDMLIHSQVISGGMAVWQENVSALTDLQEQLRLSNEQLHTANAMLQKEGLIRKQIRSAEITNQLFMQMEKDVADKSRELSELVRSLPTAENQQDQIAMIPLLLCHIKRRCNLFFLGREDTCMRANELVVYLDELSEFASYAKIHALVRSSLSGSLPVAACACCYDFYFELVRWSLKSSRAVLIGSLSRKQQLLSFDILSSEPGESIEFSQPLQEAVRQAGGRIFMQCVEDTQGIYLQLPAEGGDGL